jgi:hypothetical protein
MGAVRNLIAPVVALALGGCASATNPDPLTASSPAVVVPPAAASATPTIQTPATQSLSIATLGTTPSLKGTPTEVYERVARKALVCWFGANGPLKKSHVFNADAAPPTKGGAVEITVHERDTGGQPSPRGTRAFQVWLAAESGESTRMTLKTGKLPVDLAQAMENDTLAWGVGRDSCETQVVRPPPAPPPPEPVTAKAKQRVKTAAR